MSFLKNHINYAFSAEVAHKFGIYPALVLNRIIWSINYHSENPDRWKETYFIEGRWWMDDTYQSLSNHFQGLIAVSTIKQAIKKFEDAKLVLSRKRKSSIWDQTKWYSVDEGVLDHVYRMRHLMSHQGVTACPIEGVADVHSSSSNSLTKNHTNSRPMPSANPDASLSGESEVLNNPSQEELKPTAITSKVKAPTFGPEDSEIAKEWLDFALSQMKWKKPNAAWTIEKFAESIAKLSKSTDLNPNGIRAVLNFIKSDDFWRPNALSPASLLNKSTNGNRKIDNILLKMKPKGQSKYEKALEAVAAMEREDKKTNNGNDPF